MASTPPPSHHSPIPLTSPHHPQNFPVWQKVHISFTASLAVFSLMYAALVATPVIPLLPTALKTTPRLAHLVLTAPFFGVFFAPIYTPHLSERFGRKPVSLVSLGLFIVFVGGISAATSAKQLIILRVFAGFVGGPNAVLIEGYFADVWPGRFTVRYYSGLALAGYWGAAFGAIIGAQVLVSQGVPWTAYSALIFAAVAWCLLWTIPETYGRQIARNLNKKAAKEGKGEKPIVLLKALSGETLGEMATVTILHPLHMAVSEPIVIMASLLLGLSFATVFQWFISVPFVLNAVYGLSTTQVGLAFFSAVGGAAMACVTSFAGDLGKMKIEHRLYGAMWGIVLSAGSLFWVAWSAGKTSVAVPVIGTGVYVWGNMSIIIAVVSYIFDAYPPKGTLSALTLMACFRLVCAGILPIFILDTFASVQPQWALSILGFLHLAAIPIPFVIFFYGETLRHKSRYGGKGMSTVQMQMENEKEVAADKA